MVQGSDCEKRYTPGFCTSPSTSTSFSPTSTPTRVLVENTNTTSLFFSLTSGTVGRPSSAGLLQGAGWYYVGSRWKHFGARAPEEIEREVVAISFDDKGTVTNVERFGLEDGEVVVLSRRVTETSIKGIGLIRQVLGSFGRVSADQILNR